MSEEKSKYQMQFLSPQVLRFIDDAIDAVITHSKADALTPTIRRYIYPHRRHWRYRQPPQTVEETRAIILELEKAVKQATSDFQQSDLDAGDLDERYPIIHDVLAVMPLFNHAVVLECHRPLVKPSEIPYLLYTLKIPGYKEGLEVENHGFGYQNHGFGYHFHYGKIKSETVVRSNLLLTFDPTSNVTECRDSSTYIGPSLFGEYHSEGKNKPINMEAIGHNKRLPIYSVCLPVAEKRGFSDFKRPSKKAVVFHNGELIG